MRRITKPSPSMVMSMVALSVSLGGTSYAAVQLTGKDIKNNSLTGADIRNSSLTGSDVKNSSITGSDIKNGSLRAADFGPTSLPKGDKGDTGAQGPAGAQGPKGDTGAQGPAGPSRWVLVARDGTIEAQSGGFRIANAYPAGSAGEANVYIDSGDANLSNNGIVASVALQNQQSLKGDGLPADNAVDGKRVNGRNTGADLNPEFAGEISVSRCNIAGLVACAPNDLVANGGDGMTANRDKYFVVSPRNSDGTFTKNDSAPGAGDNTHKRFYVIISGPQD